MILTYKFLTITVVIELEVIKLFCSPFHPDSTRKYSSIIQREKEKGSKKKVQKKGRKDERTVSKVESKRTFIKTILKFGIDKEVSLVKADTCVTFFWTYGFTYRRTYI